jgi:hypothetical protein
VFFVRSTNRHCPINPEINNLHGYPWLPEALKRPILRWVQQNKPAWINYSQFPAVNWFTHRGLAKSLRKHGFVTYETFDLVRKDLLGAKKRKFDFAFDWLKKYRGLRYFVYPLLRSVQIIGIKRTIC